MIIAISPSDSVSEEPKPAAATAVSEVQEPRFEANGNFCKRGFEVTMRNRKDLYDFSEMGF